MKAGDTVYYLETNNAIKEAEVFKISGDFVTLRYTVVDPHFIPGGKHHLQSFGGIRLRKSKIFLSKKEAENYIKDRTENETRIKEQLELDRVLNLFK